MICFNTYKFQDAGSGAVAVHGIHLGRCQYEEIAYNHRGLVHDYELMRGRHPKKPFLRPEDKRTQIVYCI
jgi:hypothetical protein